MLNLVNDEALCLAGIALEVAERMPDTNYDLSRAEWRRLVVETAIKIMRDRDITIATDDLDEEVGFYFVVENT